MKVLIFNGSYNEHGNTANSITYFMKGLKEKIEIKEERIINAPRMQPNSCRGCLTCTKNDGIFCVQKDEMTEIVKSIPEYDIIIYAFPIYYYYMPGALKIILDRQLPYFDWDNGGLKQSLKQQFENKMVVCLVNCAGDDLKQCENGSAPIKQTAESYHQRYKDIHITLCEGDGLIEKNVEKQEKLIAFGKEVAEEMK